MGERRATTYVTVPVGMVQRHDRWEVEEIDFTDDGEPGDWGNMYGTKLDGGIGWFNDDGGEALGIAADYVNRLVSTGLVTTLANGMVVGVQGIDSDGTLAITLDGFDVLNIGQEGDLTFHEITKERRMERTKQDGIVLDAIAEGLRTADWSVSFLEDIADQVRKVRDIERKNFSSEGEQDWESH